MKRNWGIATIIAILLLIAGSTVYALVVQTVGNAGGAMDAAGQNATSPANELLVGGQFNTTPTTIASGKMSPIQVDSLGNTLADINQIAGNAVSVGANGVMRVAIMGRNAQNIDAATGAAVPSNAVMAGITDGTNVEFFPAGSSASVSGAAGTALTANTQANGTAQWSNIPVHALVGVDPCQSSAFAKTNKVLAVSGTSATELVAAVASKTVFVCSIWADIEGTAPTMLWQTGTKTTNPCDTSTASLTGTMAPTSGIMVQSGSGATMMTSANGGEVCVTLGGTSPKLNGVMTYVQQ